MKNCEHPVVFIVILNYNGKDTLTSCLSSVYRSNYPIFEVVVVDNDSKDGSLELAKQQFSRAHFIKNPSNVGFSRGNNVGIRFALEKFADYILVLNNDAYLRKDTISKLVKSAQNINSPVVLNPLILKEDERSVWFAGGEIQEFRMKNIHLYEIKDKIKTYPTQYCTGCAMLISKEIFRNIGLFDERYFLYYEDADFSIRAKKAGFDLLVCPSATVIHQEQSSDKNELKTYWLVLSGALFFFTHADFFQKIYLFFFFQLRKLKNFYLVTFRKSNDSLQALQAYKDYRKIKSN